MNMNKIKNNGSPNKTITSKAKNLANSAIEKTKELAKNIKEVGNKITNVAKEGVGAAQKKMSNVAASDQITGPITKWTAMTEEFLTANTAISKFVGFFLCLLLFIIIWQLGIGFINNIFGANYNPYLINGMVSSDILTIVSSNPNVANSVPIYRSVDANQGIEFTWNVWFMVNNPNNVTYNNRIFTKGGSVAGVDLSFNSNLDAEFVNVSPGLFVSNTSNLTSCELKVVMNTFDICQNSIIETIVIPQIPIQKWICCTIRVQGKTIDIYINGLLKQRKNLLYNPRQNYYDTYIGDDGGVAGYISSLRYYGYAISYDEVQTLFAAGPSLVMLTSTNMPASSDYLAMNWYTN
jgi:hypothetical protein